MLLTGAQLRMGRALLRLSMKAMAKLSDIDPGTVIRIESGENAHKLTLQRLREELEARGVICLDAVEGVHEATVALRWGTELPKRGPGKVGESSDREGGLDAMPWDDFEAEAAPIPTDIEDLRNFWRQHPAEWQALHQISRTVLLQAMEIDQL
jgi:transcriptional regulator with XRE-family HTH domain